MIMSVNPDPPIPVIEDPTSKEPAAKVGLVTSVVTAAIGLLITFGVGVTPERATAIIGFVIAVGALAPSVAAWFIRQRVWAPASVEALKQRMLKQR